MAAHVRPLTQPSQRGNGVLRIEGKLLHPLAPGASTAPPLPVNYVGRPEALAALRNSLITADGGHQIALTALQGMSGIGKTVLAQALCTTRRYSKHFPTA